MSVSGRYISHSEGENSTPFVKEHGSKLSAHQDPRYHQQRTVLQDLTLNTIQPVHHEKSFGGGGRSPATTPVAVSKPDHEAHVQFAREFVVELVENVPTKSEKASLAKHLEKENIVSQKSVLPSEGSFQSASSVAENTSLPDLLQPEFVYKKQTDTDTDTTEYDSAAETDPLDATSPLGSLIVKDLFSSFEEALDRKYPSSGEEGVVTESSPAGSSVEPGASNKADAVESSTVLSEFDKTFEYKTVLTDNSVSQGSDPSPLSETYEDAGDAAIKTSAGEIRVKPLDISGLCSCIGDLCLDSPRRAVKSDLPFDLKDTVYNSNSSSDIPIPVNKSDASVPEKCSQVTDQLEDFKGTSAGDSTFVLRDSEGSNLRDLQSFEIINEAIEAESPKEIPVLLEAAKAFDYGVCSVKDNLPTSAENDTSITKTVKVDEKTEVEFTETVKHNHTDSHQATAESNQIQEESSFILENREAAVSKERFPYSIENFQICQGVANINVAQGKDVGVATEDSKKSCVPGEVSQTDVEDVNFAPVETILHTNVTDCVQDTRSILESKLSADFDFTRTSTSLEILSADKKETSEFTDPAVHIKKSEPEIGITLLPAEEPDLANLIAARTSATSVDIGARDWKLPGDKEQEAEVVKEACTVLSELFEICNRQQKDLELGDERFVDGTQFFASPSKSTNLREKVELHSPCSSTESKFEKSILEQSVPDEPSEFDQRIAYEAERIVQEIINSSSEFHETGLGASDDRISSSTQQINSLGSTEVMADLQGVSNISATVVDENGINPFVSQSSLCRSPPPAGKPHRSSSQGPSPCESPHTKSKLSSVNAMKDGSSPNNRVSGDASPAKGSSDHRISSDKVSSLEDCPKSSVNPEINQSEAGPDIADEAQLHSGDVFKDPAAFEYLSAVGSSHVPSDLRKESLYVKFDPLVGGISRTTDKSVPLPSSLETTSSVSATTNSEMEHQSGSTTPVKNPALLVIDKLISLSPSPMKPYPVSPAKQAAFSPIKDSAPASAKQELVDISCSETVIGDNAAMVEELYLLRKLCVTQDEKHKEKIAELEQELLTLRGHVENLQSLVRESEDREAKLNKKVAEKAQSQKQMSIIMEEYEKTISRLVAEKEQERQAHELDKSTLLKDRDAAMGHLANIEIAFSDLHKKYERSKTVIEGFKKNEEVLRASLAEYEATIRKQEQKYDVLKSHAMAQLESANQELDSVHRNQQAETAKLKAMLKKAELKTSSLEEMLEQKVKENQELASICDELINKVGSC